jgi:cytochrome c oxidase subunit II
MLLLLCSCSGVQSALDPAGPSARSINRLGNVMYVGAAIVAVLVTVLIVLPFTSGRPRTANRRLFLWGGGVALPVITLSALVPYVLTVGHESRAATSPRRLTVDVTGHQYWWQLVYARGDVASQAISANELRLPAGEPVELLLHSSDVIHSFWIPSLAGKMDMIPGRENRLVIKADAPGVYRGQCAEYCGMQHALMSFDVIVLPRAEFDAWLRRLAEPVREPASTELARGKAQYESLGCGSCHTVRGVSSGTSGPDLTQVGSRRMIGAGALRGGVGNIAGWTASAQHIKPGNAMPSFNRLKGAELRELAAYLESLK